MEEELQLGDSALLDNEDKKSRNTNSKKPSFTSISYSFSEIVEEAEMLTREELYCRAYNLDDGEYGGMIKLIAYERNDERELLSHLSS